MNLKSKKKKKKKDKIYYLRGSIYLYLEALIFFIRSKLNVLCKEEKFVYISIYIIDINKFIYKIYYKIYKFIYLFD